MLVSYRTHNTSHCQTVKIVINKDQHAENYSCKFRTGSALDPFTRPASECRGTARPVHQADHCSQDNQEDQDTHIVRVCQNTDHATLKNMKDCSLEIKTGIKQSSNQDSHK